MSRAVFAATVVAALVAGFSFGAGIERASAQGQAAPAPADSRMKRIADTKTVKIAYRAAAAPFSFLDPNKQPVGYTIDLCKGVVESMGRALGGELKIEWVQVTTQNRFEAVASGQADMECGSSTVSLGRMREVDFSSIIFVESTGMVVKAASGITEGAGLAGKRIAVAANTSNERALADLVKQGKLTATLVPVKAARRLLARALRHRAAARRLGAAAGGEYRARRDFPQRAGRRHLPHLVRPDRPAAGRAPARRL
jgi:glutamate/aspartate transport system substrate-binding protein